MFKKSYSVEKATKKDESSKSSGSSGSSGLMTLKKKDKIQSLNNHESPEYQKKNLLKKGSTGWVQNKTFSNKKKDTPSKKETPSKTDTEKKK